MARRILYGMCGAVAGGFAGYFLQAGGYGIPVSLPIIAGGLVALLWAERTKRVQAPEEIHRPVTLRNADKDKH